MSDAPSTLPGELSSLELERVSSYLKSLQVPRLDSTVQNVAYISVLMSALYQYQRRSLQVLYRLQLEVGGLKQAELSLQNSQNILTEFLKVLREYGKTPVAEDESDPQCGSIRLIFGCLDDIVRSLALFPESTYRKRADLSDLRNELSGYQNSALEIRREIASLIRSLYSQEHELQGEKDQDVQELTDEFRTSLHALGINLPESLPVDGTSGRAQNSSVGLTAVPNPLPDGSHEGERNLDFRFRRLYNDPNTAPSNIRVPPAKQVRFLLSSDDAISSPSNSVLSKNQPQQRDEHHNETSHNSHRIDPLILPATDTHPIAASNASDNTPISMSDSEKSASLSAEQKDQAFHSTNGPKASDDVDIPFRGSDLSDGANSPTHSADAGAAIFRSASEGDVNSSPHPSSYIVDDVDVSPSSDRSETNDSPPTSEEVSDEDDFPSSTTNGDWLQSSSESLSDDATESTPPATQEQNKTTVLHVPSALGNPGVSALEDCGADADRGNEFRLVFPYGKYRFPERRQYISPMELYKRTSETPCCHSVIRVYSEELQYSSALIGEIKKLLTQRKSNFVECKRVFALLSRRDQEYRRVCDRLARAEVSSENLKNALTQRASTAREFQKQLEGANTLIKKLQASASQSDSVCNELQAKVENLEIERQGLNMANEQLSKNQSEILQRNIDTKVELDSEKKQVFELRQALDNSKASEEELRIKLKSLETLEAETKTSKDKLTVSNQLLTEKVQELEGTLAQLSKAFADLKESYSMMSSLSDDVPYLVGRHPPSPHDSLQRENESLVRKCSQKSAEYLHALNLEREKTASLNEKLTNQAAEVAQLRIHVSSKDARINKLESELRIASDALESHKVQLSEVRKHSEDTARALKKSDSKLGQSRNRVLELEALSRQKDEEISALGDVARKKEAETDALNGLISNNNNEIRELKNLIQTKDDQTKVLEDLVRSKDLKNQELENRIANAVDLYAQSQDLKQNMDRISAEYKQTVANLSLLEGEKVQLQQTAFRYEQDLSTWKAMDAGYQTTIANLENELQLSAKSYNALEQVMHESQLHISSLSAEKSKLESTVSTQRALIDTMSKELSDLKALFNSLTDKKRNAVAQVTELTESHLQKVSQMDDLSRQLQQVKSDKDQIEMQLQQRRVETEELKKALEQRKDELQTKAAELAEARVSVADLEFKVSHSLPSLQDERDALKLAIADAEDRYRLLSASLDRVSNERDQAADYCKFLSTSISKILKLLSYVKFDTDLNDRIRELTELFGSTVLLEDNDETTYDMEKIAEYLDRVVATVEQSATADGDEDSTLSYSPMPVTEWATSAQRVDNLVSRLSNLNTSSNR